MSEQLDRIERYLIERNELEQLGHRLIYDTKTGVCKNVGGLGAIDPALLDKDGYQVRLPK